MTPVTRATHVVDGHRLDVRSIASAGDRAPIVLLHEGLGSIELWRDFPDRLAVVSGRAVITYSRYGHGRSDRLTQARTVDYMHHEARVVLPELLALLNIDTPVLFGHSDGASIALLYAALESARPVALVLEAPHVFVEPLTVVSITHAKEAAATTDLLEKLGRYHDDAASTFQGWNDVWLDPAFLDWSITDTLPSIRAPVLMIQGRDDEYGSAAQLTAIAAAVRQSTTVLLDRCGHSPHRAQRDTVLDRTRTFLETLP